MDIVSRLTSYARAVPAGLKAAGQELVKTAASATAAETPGRPAGARGKPKKKAVRRAAPSTQAKGTRASPKAKAKRAARPKGRNATG